MDSASNCFNLPDPDEMKCTVWAYKVSFGVLRIKIEPASDADNAMWLTFDGAVYFEGPTQWQGANFRLGTPQEHLELRYLLGHHRYASDQQLLENAKLFIVPSKAEWLTSTTLNIKILARDGGISPSA